MALTEDEITRFLAGRHHAVLGINRKHASPHLTPVWYLWNGRTFDFLAGISRVMTGGM